MLKKSGLKLGIALAICSIAGQAYAQKDHAAQEGMNLDSVQASGLSVDQAKQVLMVVLRHERLLIKKPGFNIEDLHDSVPGYVNFFVTFDSPKAAATDVIGGFSVSPRTGDVWETNLCKHYSFPELKRIQRSIMARTNATFKSELQERSQLGCTDD